MSEPDRPNVDLAALYEEALRTGQAGALVRALLDAYRINLRGLEALSGLPYGTLQRWSKDRYRAMGRTLRELLPLIRPNQRTQAKIAKARTEHRFTSTGRPPKR